MAAAFALSLILAYLSDRLRLRLPFIAFGIALIITGLGILTTLHGHHHFSAEYLGICFVAMGTFATAPIVLCWYIMNLQGHTQRCIGTAFVISCGNTAGIVATFSFLSKDAPLYHTGYSICLGVTCLGVLAATACAGLVLLERKKLQVKEEKGEVQMPSL